MAQGKKGDKRVVVGDITGISGEVNIAAGDIYKGYTAEQVSILLTQISSQFKPKPFDGRCPYKGLEVFEEEDADLFFGRERIVEDLLNRVKESRTIFITGPSGSGKSSLVRAGLLHSLKKGALKGSDTWLYETMKPGREPLKELALAFSRLKSPDLANYFQAHANEISVLHDCAESVLSARKDQRFVLFVDQFEEVFTQVNNEQERGAFLNMLAHAGTAANGRVIVLFAMRSDFVSNCATYPALNELLSQEFRQIGAMQPEELVSAIALPARHVGLPIEDELIARIINDMKGEPGALPLMQFALKDLFDSQQAQGGVIALTLEDYLRHGGIHKSLERHANKSFAQLDSGEQDLARSIFSGLIEIGRGTSDTRRTALFDELIPADATPEDVESIIRKLADARLIITDEHAGKDTVTISHEKLIDAWPWLKKLVNENRDVIALQNEIAGDAKEWDDHGRDPSYLYTGARLVNAREQLATRKLVLSGLAREFVQTSQARQRRGQVVLSSGISAVIVMLVVAVIVFSRQSAENKQLAQQARIRELAAQAQLLRDRNLQTSLLLGLEVFRRWDIPQTRGVLLDNVQTHPHLRQFLTAHAGAINAVAFSPDNKILVSGSEDNSLMVWDLNTSQPMGEPLTGHTGPVTTVAFHPDGSVFASAGVDQTIRLWDLSTRQPIGEPLAGHTGSIHRVVFSPKGEILVSVSDDRTVMLWDLSTHQPLGQLPVDSEGSIYDLAFSPDGQILALGGADRTIFLWDLVRRELIGQPITGHDGSIYSLGFSRDGRIMASGSDDNTIILWDVETQQPLGPPLTGHASRITSLAFSPTDDILVSGSLGGTIIIWDVDKLEPIGQPLIGHTGFVYEVAFSPDGKTVASAGFDNSIIIWDIFAQSSIADPLARRSGSAYAVAFSPDGKTLAAGFYDGSIALWDRATLRQIEEPLLGNKSSIFALAFSPDGKILVSGSDNGAIVLWDVATQQQIGEPFSGHSTRVSSVAFRSNGKMLASGGLDGNILLWNIDTHQQIGSPLRGHSGRVNSLAFRSDGALLASGGDRDILLWDMDSHQQVGQAMSGHKGVIYNVAFHPNGMILASGSDDNTLRLWDVETQQAIGQPLRGHSSRVSSLAFGPDGRILASGGFDSMVILWDVASRQPIGQPLSGHTGSIYSVAFSPDGQTLASGSADNRIILWDLDPQSWITKTCWRVGRNLSRAEWSQYFPEEEYRKTCDQWLLEP